MTSASLLIECWEAAQAAPAEWRGLALLQAAGDGEGPDALARLAVGRRDSRLLELHRALFGDAIEGLASCPACGLTVEVGFRVGDIAIEPIAGAPTAVERDGWSIEFRLPDSRDMWAAAAGGDLAQARSVLIERCVLRMTRNSA